MHVSKGAELGKADVTDLKPRPLNNSADIESNWVTKNDKHYYGLKEHASVDAKYGFVLATVLSPASVHDTNYFHTRKLSYDTSKLKSDFGIEQKVSLEKGFAECCAEFGNKN